MFKRVDKSWWFALYLVLLIMSIVATLLTYRIVAMKYLNEQQVENSFYLIAPFTGLFFVPITSEVYDLCYGGEDNFDDFLT